MNDTEIRIKQIIYQLPDAIVVCDHQAKISYINLASADLLGISPQEAVGKPFADIVTLIDEQTDEPIEDISQKAMRSGQDETAVSNALLLASDGLTELPVEVIARPLTTKDQSINGALVTIHDVRSARFSRRQLSWNASHDSLTGVFNRFEFDRQAHALLLTAKRDNSRHSLLLIDIDHFKHLNEMTNHITGDHLLIKLSELLRSLLRANDGLFRSAADQFLILLPHCQLANVAKVATKQRY
jgi:PAS domain S-box-containing protein